MKISKYLLEIVVFVCGAVVMIFELVGSRVLGPYFGTSIFEYRTVPCSRYYHYPDSI